MDRLPEPTGGNRVLIGNGQDTRERIFPRLFEHLAKAGQNPIPLASEDLLVQRQHTLDDHERIPKRQMPRRADAIRVGSLHRGQLGTKQAERPL